jgi:predicted alpha/beta hydrolase family esterase
MATPTDFLIIHGTLGGPESNWFPWLKQKLAQGGHKVSVPHFPTPEDQSFASWHIVAEQALKEFNPDRTVLIGHSTGAVCVLRLAEIASKPYQAVFSICPFVRDLGLDPYDRLNSSFVHHPFDWQRIKNKAGSICCFAGDDDPYVPLSYSVEVAEKTGGDLTIVEKGGHLNAETGFLEFPLLLDRIGQTGAV